MKAFLLAFTIVFSILSVLVFIVAGLDPRNFWIFSICSLFIPVIFILNIILFFFWLVFHWKYIFLPFLTVLAGWYHWGLMLSTEGDREDQKCRGDYFTVLSFNLYGLKQLKSKEESKFNANKSKFLSFIRNTDPDVLCVQENNLFSDAMITQSEVFPYSHYIVQHGAAIYSKHPIMDKGSIEFGTKTNSCLWAEVLIHGKKIRVYSVHLQSNRVSKDLEKMTDNQDENSSEQISILRRIFGNYKRMAVVRAEQAEIIRDHAMRSSSPVILCGDLNDTPFSYPYDVFSQRYKDSFLESGVGLGPTYHGVLPGLRIDYVFADKRKFEFCFHRVLQTPFSDHSPVSVKMYGR